MADKPETPAPSGFKTKRQRAYAMGAEMKAAGVNHEEAMARCPWEGYAMRKAFSEGFKNA